MRTKISTDVSSEPIDTTFLKEYLNQLEAFSATETTLLNTMIKSARELCEEFTGLCLAEKTLITWFSMEEVEMNDRYLELPNNPHSSITSVHSINAEGTGTLMTENTNYYKRGIAGGEYEIYITDTIATIGAEITITDYKVTYVAGYSAANCEAIPSKIKTIMGTIIAGWWNNRKAWVPVMEEEFKAMLTPYKKTRF